MVGSTTSVKREFQLPSHLLHTTSAYTNGKQTYKYQLSSRNVLFTLFVYNLFPLGVPYKVYIGRLHPEVQLLNILYTTLTGKVLLYSFYISFIEKWYLFYLPTECISF